MSTPMGLGSYAGAVLARDTLMDQIGLHLAKATKSKEWMRSHLTGMHAAARIAECVRIEQKLTRSDLRGTAATVYLDEVLARLQKHAETEASKSFGRYRWLWYLRRLPDEIFAGSLSTTEIPKRHITEVLATRGAGASHVMSGPSHDGMFPMDGTVIKRIAWICGFAHAFLKYQVIFRVAGKGGSVNFDESLPGLTFPVARSVRDELLDLQIREYDRRNELQMVFTKVGVAIDPYASKSHKDQPILFLIGKVQGEPQILDAKEFAMKWPVAMRYAPTAIPISEISKIVQHPHIKGIAFWSPELPILISLSYLVAILFSQSPENRSRVLQAGYMVVYRKALNDLYHESREELYQDEPLLAALPADTSNELFSERLLRMEGCASPLLGGPVAFVVDAERVGIDIFNASRRLLDSLQFPAVQGEMANVRGKAFEESVQSAIDQTAWAPPASIKRLIGHHFKEKGKAFGEVDAFAASGRTLILVSCKSLLYTADYDRGNFAVVRNARTTLENADSKFAELVAHFIQYRKRGHEYDFTAYDMIASVVITPQVMYVAEPLLSKMSLPGLRSYSSYEEFRSWLLNTG